jgi:hypothetical protein
MNPSHIDTPAAGQAEPDSASMVPPQWGGAVSETPPSASQQGQFLLCEHCQAPVDRDQRYCVRCGGRQSHARNPATSYFATAARSRRTGAPRPRSHGTLRGPVFALLLVLLPVSVAAGVLVGRSGSGSNDSRLLAELAKQPVATAPATAPSTTPASGATASGNLPSDFTLTHGFAVKLSTLPLQSTDQATVAKVEQQDRAKGAAQVGLINPKDFKTTPDQGASNYVVYSGQFKTRAQAIAALAKIRSRFPGAAVIAVSQRSSAAAAVVAHTEFGTVHQVAGSRATAQQIQEDKKVVQKINRTVGKSYVEAQKGLPDVIAVTGGEGSSTTGNSVAEKAGEH